MKQQTLAVAADQASGFENHRRPTRRDEFLKTMEAIVPWVALCAVIEPHYPKAGNGRPPIGLERMLRIHLIQHWFNLADLSCEEAMYDSASLRRFLGIDLGREPVPDATTILKFRRLLNAHKLGEALFSKVGEELQARGFKVNTAAIVDATIIDAPSSTKNTDKARDPQMHQTRKGWQWYFGMKLHIGVDSRTTRRPLALGVVLMPGDRLALECLAVEIAVQHEGAIVLDLVPVEAKQGVLGFEVAAAGSSRRRDSAPKYFDPALTSVNQRHRGR